MNFKLALAAAAVVGLAGTAQAADLAKKAPAAANYVKVCDAYGAGYFYIPGSDTCLKIGGFVRFQATVFGPNKNWDNQHATWGWSRNHNGLQTFTRADITLDARTNTELGLLRSYIDVIADNGSYGTVTNTTNAYIHQAFIQFAGLTAGRASSFFDFVTNATLTSTATPMPDAKVNLLAYTFSFGNGISASLSIEDPSTAGNGNPLTSTAIRRSTLGAPYGGVHSPDLVANLNVTQAWGAAQIAGVLHMDDAAAGTSDQNKAGYAVLAGVKVNLPMLGAKDQLALQVVYGKGAVGYVLDGWQNSPAASGGFGAVDFWTDAAGSIVQASGTGFYGSLTHGWTPSLASALGVGYASYKGARSDRDFAQLDIRANLAWTPVANLTITGEVSNLNVYYSTEAKANVGLRNENRTNFDLRIQRSF